jgi:lipopolysaccharide export system permease protein
MKLLDRHILRELIGPFLFGVAAFTSIMFASNELFRITELLAEYHAPIGKAAELMLLHMPSIVVVTLPMSMLLAALLGFGRLSGDSEVVALFAGGISLYRIAVPVILVAVLVTGAGFVLSEVIAPSANARHAAVLMELKNEPISSNKPFFVIDAKDGITNNVFYVQGGFNLSTSTLRKVALIQYKSDKNDNKPDIFVYGEEARLSGGKDSDANEWVFSHGYSKTLASDSQAGGTAISMFETLRVKISKTPEQIASYQRKPEEMTFSQLRQHISMLQTEGQDVNEYRVRLYQKIALPLSTLVFALIGAPLGLRPHRSSSSMGLGLSIVIIFAYWVLMHYMTILGENGRLSPVAANFIPTLAGAATGVALIVRASK